MLYLHLINTFVLCLLSSFSLLSQLSMLSEVRSLVAPQDLEVYDRLVVHREREAHQVWHGGLSVLHPQGPCNHAVSGIHDAGDAVPAAVGLLSTVPQNGTFFKKLCGIILTLTLIPFKPLHNFIGSQRATLMLEFQGYFVIMTNLMHLLVTWLLAKSSDEKYCVNLIYCKIIVIWKQCQLAQIASYYFCEPLTNIGCSEYRLTSVGKTGDVSTVKALGVGLVSTLVNTGDLLVYK